MTNYKQQLDDLHEEINHKKLDRAKLEERIKTLKEDQKLYKDKIKELNINDISSLKEEIEILNEQIDAGIQKTKKAMEKKDE